MIELSTQSHLTACYASRHYVGRVISEEGIAGTTQNVKLSSPNWSTVLENWLLIKSIEQVNTVLKLIISFLPNVN